MVALQTFQNLKPERQKEIILVCLEEFSRHDYEAASLSDIIKKLNLAKGSFYRYFESKQALYLFLLEVCLQTRVKHDEGFISVPASDFFELYAQHFEARLKFETSYPVHSAFLYTLLRQKSTPELGVIQATARKRIVELMKPGIQEDIKNKRIRKDVDPELLAFLMAQTQQLINDYIGYKHNSDYADRLLDKKAKKIPEKEIMQAGKDILAVLKTGFQLR